MSKNIYKHIAASVIATVVAIPAMAQTKEATGITVEKPQLMRNASFMTVSMDLNLSELELKSNRAAVFVPVIVNGANQVKLPAVSVYGRLSWYQYVRSGVKPMSGADEVSYRYSQRPSIEQYSRSVPYEKWMDGADLVLTRHDFGCCNDPVDQQSEVLSTYAGTMAVAYTQQDYTPTFHYISPVVETVKMRASSGSAYIDFPVNRTELHPDFRNNQAELAKIVATIDSVRNDNDITVTSLTIKGVASPEGDYENNTRLAQGRTEALKNYVDGLYHFGVDFIVTDYEPEDWAGLRKYVAGSRLVHKREILQIIDDQTLDIDLKDRRIQARYGDEYIFLLNEVYPTLRRSDYRIEYTVCSYNDVETIRKIMATTPYKLSLNEMYRLAQTMEPGSDEYNEVFETAVRLYPNDETANLNAANAAMSRKDLHRAERYLAHAGNSAEAVYARGVLAGLQGDKESAERLIRQAGTMGLKDTDAAIELLLNSR